MRSLLSIDPIGLLSWLNWRFAINHRWTLWSITDIAIDLFTLENWYFLWITTVALCVYNPDHIWDRTCVCGCYTREEPDAQSVTSVGSSLLDSSMLLWFHQPITSSIIYLLPVPPACWYKLNCNWFNDHERLIFFLSIDHQQSAISSCWLLWLLVIVQWL